MTEYTTARASSEALSEEARAPGLQYVVGAVLLDETGRAYLQQRSWHVRHFPGCWDIVGGHVETDETLIQALAREVREETGWRLGQIHRVAAIFDWYGNDDIQRREIDVVAEAAGNLGRPALEPGKFIDYAWADEKTLRRMARTGTQEDIAMIQMCLNVVTQRH